jgi:hypothetical protein
VLVERLGAADAFTYPLSGEKFGDDDTAAGRSERGPCHPGEVKTRLVDFLLALSLYKEFLLA